MTRFPLIESVTRRTYESVAWCVRIAIRDEVLPRVYARDTWGTVPFGGAGGDRQQAVHGAVSEALWYGGGLDP